MTQPRITPILIAVLLTATCAGCLTSRIFLMPEDERREYVQTHDRPHRIAAAIVEGRIVNGMSPADVKAVRGRPTRVNLYASGRRVQWVYRMPSFGVVYVYFENDRVVNWQRV